MVAAPPRIAVVGSGVAALTATRTLGSAAATAGSPLEGASITLCTSRSKFATQMGPRNQTPPKNGQPFFDYACQYITASLEDFSLELDRWERLGVCQALPSGSVGALDAASGFAPFEGGSGSKCHVGRGGMGPMMVRLLEECAASSQHVQHEQGFPDETRKVVGLRRGADGRWTLTQRGGGELGPFDFVLGGFSQRVLTEPFLASGGAAAAAMLRCLRRVESNQIIAMQATQPSHSW